MTTTFKFPSSSKPGITTHIRSMDKLESSRSIDRVLPQDSISLNNSLNTLTDSLPSSSLNYGDPNRDALLTRAYQLYHAPRQPLIPSALPQGTENLYRSQLLPILNNLRDIRPTNVNVLLLLSCTYHALGDMRTSINISLETLAIVSDCVKYLHSPSHSLVEFLDFFPRSRRCTILAHL